MLCAVTTHAKIRRTRASYNLFSTCVLDSRLVIIQNSRGNISTPNYPAQYPKNTEITWKITIPNGTKIAFWINDMDVKKYGNCFWDWVQVDDGRRWCGTSKGFPILSSGTSLVVKFISSPHEKTGFRGFFASFSTAKPGKRKPSIFI